MARTMTITMLDVWPSRKCVWLEVGTTHTIDWELGRLLLALKKAKFSGSALELFKQN